CGSWRLNPESTLVANFELGGYDLPTFASVGEAGGGMTRYTHTSKIKLKNGKTVSQFTLDPQNQDGYTNAGSGAISGQTNPFNTSVRYWKLDDPKNDERFVWLGEIVDGTGSIRTFSSSMHKWNKTNLKMKLKNNYTLRLSPLNWTPYALPIRTERKPNGNIVQYDYHRWREDKHFPRPCLLKSITTYNHNRSKVLSSVNFNYDQYTWRITTTITIGSGRAPLQLKEDIGEVASFSVTGSDGRCASYQLSRTSGYTPPHSFKRFLLPEIITT
ncbi:MAG: hypothetical protein KR126chlam2_01296, partial [Chlamydiae bacterium]|nr:hypothetical protein [Chlamydiota bacterium]